MSVATLGVLSLLAIFYQTSLCVTISWLTLSCRLSPAASELAEVTLVKLLYLYDPEACGRIHFYNYTTTDTLTGAGTAVVWPVRNNIAAGFRRKLKIWLILHIIWSVLAIVNISHGNRPISFYVTLLPFTLVGITILVVDMVFCGLFLADIPYTGSEADILDYIDSVNDDLRSINGTIQRPADAGDTSWISFTLAYCSVRGIVQWILNFWIVKDTHINGLTIYHHLQQMSHMKRRSRSKSMQVYRIDV